MAKSLKFDPITRDLVRDGKGWFEWTPHADTTVMHQLLVRGGEAWHDPLLGSRLHDLRAMQGKPEVVAEGFAKQALDVLVSRGRVSNVEVVAEVPKTGRVLVATKFRDASTGQIVPMKIPAGR